jgi:hypothetical protein
MTLKTERIHLGEVEGVLPADVEAALKASDEEILEAYPPRVIAARLEERRRPRATRAIWLLLPVLAAGLFMVSVEPEVASEPGLEMTTSKGLPELLLHREDGARLFDQDPAAPGDRLMVSYIAGGWPQGAIFSVDGEGVVTQHHPHSGSHSAPLERGGSHALGRSYQLDDAPEFERFFLVADTGSFDLEPVREALARNPDTPDVGDHVLSTLTLRKHR